MLKWLIRYYAELCKEIGILLLKGKWKEIAYITITTGIGFLIDTKGYIKLYTNINLGQVPTPVLNGLLAGITILVSLFLYTPMRIFRTNQKKIALLEERQQPKLEIYFDPESCFKDTCEPFEDKPIGINFSYKWGVFVHNTSTTDPIKNVEVKLIDINKCLFGDARTLKDVHLKFEHDNNREWRSISINPSDHKFVEVIDCYVKDGKNGEKIAWIQHVEKNDLQADLKLFYNNFDKDDCKIRIEVTGENTTCKPKNFVVGLRDKVIKMWKA